MLPPTLVILGLLLASSSFAHAGIPRTTSLAGVQALIATRESAAGLEAHREYIEHEIAAWPENLPALYAEPKFRAWYPLRRLTERPIRDIERVSRGLASPDPLTRILVGLQLAQADPNALHHLEFVVASLGRLRFARDRNGRDELVFEELTTITLEDFDALVDLVDRALGHSREESYVLRDASLRLPALPTGLDYTHLGERYGSLQLRLFLGPERVDESENLRRLTPIVLDHGASRPLRLAAAREFRRLPIGHPAKVELERILKWQHQNATQPRWWTRSKAPRENFFVADRGLAAEMFRAWQSRDEHYVGYLLDVARGRGRGDVLPADAVDTLMDLELPDKRFLFLFESQLAKTMNSNMPLFFRAFVRLWPEDARRISSALFVVRNVPEIYADYLDVLVDAAERLPILTRALRDARRNGRLGRAHEISIEGLILDEWIERELERRACARALDSASTKDTHAQS